MIKHGLKLWSSNYNLFKSVKESFDRGDFDFLELYTVPGTFSEKKFNELKNMPINIHAPHFLHNFNLMLERERNLNTFEEVKKFANLFESDYIVVHPGVPGTEGNFDILKKNISIISDKRIIIENMPFKGLKNTTCFGNNINQIKRMVDLTNGLCLDFGHATKAALSNNLDYKEFTKELLKLNPYVFHISDGFIDSEIDEHLDLGSGDYDLTFMKQQILKNKNKMVVLETPKKDNNINNDLRNIEFFKNL
jgi:deoxyribonuclease IV